MVVNDEAKQEFGFGVNVELIGASFHAEFRFVGEETQLVATLALCESHPKFRTPSESCTILFRLWLQGHDDGYL